MDVKDLLPVIEEVKTATTGRLEGFEAKQLELQTIVADLAQKSARGAGLAPPQSSRVSGSVKDLAQGVERLRSGNVKSERFEVKSFHIERKAAVSTDFAPVPARDPEWYPAPRRQFSVRDLLVQRPTTAGAIEFLQLNRTGTAQVQVAEGDVKASVDLAATLKTAPVRTVAVWTGVSRQALDDVTLLEDAIDGELQDALQIAEDEQLLRGDGIGSNISGLLTNATPYSRYQVGDLPRDTLRRAITQVQLARGIASGIVISPVALEQIELDKDADGNYVLSLPVSDGNGRTTLWRVPCVVSDVMTADEFLVGDFTRAARLYDRQVAHIEISLSHADYFVRNLVAILAEERLALTIPRPTMLVRGAFD